jgi:predicted deacetylase
LDLVLDLGLPGLVFLGLSVWLIRKVARAARTERDLEGERLEGALAEELREGKARAAGMAPPRLEVVQPPPEALRGADLRGADLEHVTLVAELIRAEGEGRVEVLWVRSNRVHAVWSERRRAGASVREVIRVVRIEGGVVMERWSFG